MKRALAALTLALALSVVPTAAQAAPAEQACGYNTVDARDMAGTYSAPGMMVVVFPCGGIYVQWDNAYGTHAAAYTAQDRVPGQGIIARSAPTNELRLDTSNVLGVKAAERGYVQIFTVNDITREERVYRLRKIS